MVRAVVRPLVGCAAIAFLLSGFQPVSADTQRAANEADGDRQGHEVLIVRDYAGYDEISLPLDARPDAGSVRAPAAEPSPQTERPVPALLSAAQLSRSLDADGKVVLGGISFDAGGELQPSSKAALDQVGALLKQRPALRLHVVGHTDNTGALASNRELSKRHAHAICVALVIDYGIARDRLTADGIGSLSPVVSNQSGRGRARNRRIELVVQ